MSPLSSVGIRSVGEKKLTPVARALPKGQDMTQGLSRVDDQVDPSPIITRMFRKTARMSRRQSPVSVSVDHGFCVKRFRSKDPGGERTIRLLREAPSRAFLTRPLEGKSASSVSGSRGERFLLQAKERTAGPALQRESLTSGGGLSPWSSPSRIGKK